jgi:hypothetical protein
MAATAKAKNLSKDDVIFVSWLFHIIHHPASLNKRHFHIDGSMTFHYIKNKLLKKQRALV